MTFLEYNKDYLICNENDKKTSELQKKHLFTNIDIFHTFGKTFKPSCPAKTHCLVGSWNRCRRFPSHYRPLSQGSVSSHVAYWWQVSPLLLCLLQQPHILSREKQEVMENACSENKGVHILWVQVDPAMQDSPPGGHNAKSIINHHPCPWKSVVKYPLLVSEVLSGVWSH